MCKCLFSFCGFFVSTPSCLIWISWAGEIDIFPKMFVATYNIYFVNANITPFPLAFSQANVIFIFDIYHELLRSWLMYKHTIHHVWESLIATITVLLVVVGGCCWVETAYCWLTPFYQLWRTQTICIELPALSVKVEFVRNKKTLNFTFFRKSIYVSERGFSFLIKLVAQFKHTVAFNIISYDIYKSRNSYKFPVWYSFVTVRLDMWEHQTRNLFQEKGSGRDFFRES